MPLIDLTGQRFGRLTVISLAERSSRSRTYWSCRCDCGNTCAPRADALKRPAGTGAAHSCGCLQRDKVSQKGRPSSSRLPSFSADELRQKLHYDRETGLFRWSENGVDAAHAGKEAGHIDSEGYRIIGFEGRNYKGHLLAWYHVTGEWPGAQIDHKDTIRRNNAWENLRPATNQQNQFNKGPNKNNRSGFKGVYHAPDNRLRPWKAKIRAEGKNVHLGYFGTAEAASQAYYAKASQLIGDFARAWSN